MAEHLLLKWGTLKGWKLETEQSLAAAKVYGDTGEHSLGAATQHDTPEQKDALCGLIDAVAASGGEIQNDWTGEKMTAEEAKEYVRSYGKSAD